MLHGSPSSVRAVCSVAFAGLAIGVAGWALFAGDAPALAAANNQTFADQDRDGLSDAQELVLRTLPTRADTDGDGYSDPEECARGSDPLVAASIPGDDPYSVGTFASQQGAYVSVLVAMYADDVDPADLRLHFGVIYRGAPLYLRPRQFQYSRVRIQPAHDGRRTVGLLELGVPVSLVQRLRRLDLFAIVGDGSPSAPPPSVGLLSLAESSGVVLSIERRYIGLTGGGGASSGGVVYRPLTGDDQIPFTWDSGKVCFQRTVAVGMRGVSVVYEVTGADCVSMDTYCAGSCGDGVGAPLELPDPGALIGG